MQEGEEEEEVEVEEGSRNEAVRGQGETGRERELEIREWSKRRKGWQEKRKREDV